MSASPTRAACIHTGKEIVKSRHTPVKTSPRAGSPRRATSRTVFAVTLSLSTRWRVVGRSHMSPGDEGMGQCPAVLLWLNRTVPDPTDETFHVDEMGEHHEAIVRRKELDRLPGPAREHPPLKSVPDVQMDQTRGHHRISGKPRHSGVLQESQPERPSRTARGKIHRNSRVCDSSRYSHPPG